MAPGINAIVPIAQLLPALLQATLGHKDAAQTAINNVLLTTTALSILYYGYDELADLLNVEAAAQDLKVQIYAAVWDEADPQRLPARAGPLGSDDRLTRVLRRRSATRQSGARTGG